MRKRLPLSQIQGAGLALCFAASFVPEFAAALTLLGSDASAKCASLTQASDGKLVIDSAVVQDAKPLSVGEKAPTPASRVSPATPSFCKVLAHIDPADPKAPPIRFEVNLPIEWNGRSVQYGGGGFNGVLITGLGLPPAMPFDRPSPLAQGYVTYGTDSGHESKPSEPPQLFALNDEAFLNFAHAAYKKVHDAAATLMTRAYGQKPDKMYFMGSSEGGREALTMAQRYPQDFDGILARVPVINWTGLVHASARSGLISMGDAYIRPAQVKLVADAVLKACDKDDGSDDGIVENAFGCKTKFKPAALRCASGQSGDACLSEPQIKAIDELHAAYRFPFKLANGLDDYPGWGVSGEANPAFGPTGGWSSWWLGSAAPVQPPQQTNGIAWVYGAGAMQYVFARDPNLDVTKYKPENYKARVLEVSALMDSTDPDLSAFRAHGGKLVMLEHMSDYAQSPYAGIRYFQRVQHTMGTANATGFLRLYTAPGVDHVGSGAPGNVDMLAVLVDWVEHGKPPADLIVAEQTQDTPFAAARSLPLCEWPAWPHYKNGDVKNAASYACAP